LPLGAAQHQSWLDWILGPLKAFFHNKRLFGIFLMCVGAAVVIGWAIIAPTNWSNVLTSHSRLGYLIGDGFLVAPGCILSGYGYYSEATGERAGTHRGFGWAPAAFLITIGAATFDLTHTFIYMAEIGVPRFGGSAPPMWVYALVILLLWAIMNMWAWYVIRTEVAPDSGITPWSWLKGYIPAAILVVIAVALAYIFG
jgi:hypothetical protein